MLLAANNIHEWRCLVDSRLHGWCLEQSNRLPLEREQRIITAIAKGKKATVVHEHNHRLL